MVEYSVNQFNLRPCVVLDFVILRTLDTVAENKRTVHYNHDFFHRFTGLKIEFGIFFVE